MPRAPDLDDFNTSERIPVSIDFTAGLPPGDSVTSVASVALSVYFGTDPNVSSLLSGTPSLSGNIVTQTISTGGVPGVTYRITMTVITAASATISLYSHIFCAPVN
jgi:hypothetical protein